MQLAGCYAWKGNDSYGSNHRFLTISPGREPETHRFVLDVTASAGPMGSSGSKIRGRVEPIDAGRFMLVAETDESWVHDDDPWSETTASTGRFELVIRKSWWFGQRITLDGEPYVPRKVD